MIAEFMHLLFQGGWKGWGSNMWCRDSTQGSWERGGTIKTCGVSEV